MILRPRSQIFVGPRILHRNEVLEVVFPVRRTRLRSSRDSNPISIYHAFEAPVVDGMPFKFMTVMFEALATAGIVQLLYHVADFAEKGSHGVNICGYKADL